MVMYAFIAPPHPLAYYSHAARGASVLQLLVLDVRAIIGWSNPCVVLLFFPEHQARMFWGGCVVTACFC